APGSVSNRSEVYPPCPPGRRQARARKGTAEVHCWTEPLVLNEGAPWGFDSPTPCPPSAILPVGELLSPGSDGLASSVALVAPPGRRRACPPRSFSSGTSSPTLNRGVRQWQAHGALWEVGLPWNASGVSSHTRMRASPTQRLFPREPAAELGVRPRKWR